MKSASWMIVANGIAIAMHYNNGVGAQTAENGFSLQDQAIWLDRYNYFRMTALPYAASNMLKMKWNADLATQAVTDAKTCSTTFKTGVNVHVTQQKNDTMELVDCAFTTWAVQPALKSASALKPPRAGEPVGTGIYNSYSQIVWSSTSDVGCAKVSCGDGKVGVACRYSTPGNDGSSPWYTQGEPGTSCPTGTVSKVGLCVQDGADYGSAIPDVSKAYNFYKGFMSEMQKALTQSSSTPASSPSTTDSAGKVKPYDGDAKPAPASATPASDPAKTPASDPAKTPAVNPTPASDPAKTPAVNPTPASDPAKTPSTDPAPAPNTNPAPATPASDPQTQAGSSPVVAGVVVANNKAEQKAETAGFSAAGVAGCVILGIFVVVGVAVFISYKSNQKRQRDIMQNGGIHIL